MSPLLTLHEVAAVLRVSVSTVRRLVASGELRVVRVRRRPLVSEKELEAFVSASFRRAA